MSDGTALEGGIGGIGPVGVRLKERLVPWPRSVLSNTVRRHRRLRQAGVPAALRIFEAMPHGGFFGGPEEADKNEESAALARIGNARRVQCARFGAGRVGA